MPCFFCKRTGEKICGMHCGLCAEHDDYPEENSD